VRKPEGKVAEGHEGRKVFVLFRCSGNKPKIAKSVEFAKIYVEIKQSLTDNNMCRTPRGNFLACPGDVTSFRHSIICL